MDGFVPNKNTLPVTAWDPAPFDCISKTSITRVTLVLSEWARKSRGDLSMGELWDVHLMDEETATGGG